MPTPLMAFFRAPPTTTDPQILFKTGNRDVYAVFDLDATVSPPRLTVEYLDTNTNVSLYRLTLTPNDISPSEPGGCGLFRPPSPGVHPEMRCRCAACRPAGTAHGAACARRARLSASPTGVSPSGEDSGLVPGVGRDEELRPVEQRHDGERHQHEQPAHAQHVGDRSRAPPRWPTTALTSREEEPDPHSQNSAPA